MSHPRLIHPSVQGLFDQWNVADQVGPIIGDTAANVKVLGGHFRILMIIYVTRRCSVSQG